jgi:hypothetical protein
VGVDEARHQEAGVDRRARRQRPDRRDAFALYGDLGRPDRAGVEIDEGAAEDGHGRSVAAGPAT